MERRMEGSIERIINLRVRAQRVGRAQGVRYPKKCMRVAACVGVRVRWGTPGVVCLGFGGMGVRGGMGFVRVFSKFLLIPKNISPNSVYDVNYQHTICHIIKILRSVRCFQGGVR